MNSVRIIREKTNEELRKNTDYEILEIEKVYKNNRKIELINELNDILSNKGSIYKEELIRIIESNIYRNENKINENIQIINKIISSLEYDKTSFSKFNCVQDMYQYYKSLSLILKRIAFGLIENESEYIQELCNHYDILMEDIIFVKRLEKL